VPVHICWGKDDKVSSMAIANYLKDNICTQANLSLMENTGHFCMLGNPNEWLNKVLAYYK